MEKKCALRVTNLVKNFDGLKAVRGVSFDVQDGSIFGLIGPNGAGKTTTFNIVAGAEKPTSGDIYLYDSKITGLPTHNLYHQGLVRTFQLSHEYPKMSVLENLLVAGDCQPGENIFENWLFPTRVLTREKELFNRANESLHFLGLEHLSHELAGNLSGGQKKLLELGRTMMTDAKLVLLDEPGAGVNPTLMVKIIDMIKKLNRERNYTFCIIEHDMDLIAELCDDIVVLVEGKILTEGTMSQVRKDSRVVDAYFGGSEL